MALSRYSTANCIKKKSESGSTFLELLIASVILAVLAALSVPVYQNHVLHSNRALAKTILADLALQQEKYALQHGSYAADFDALLGDPHSNAKNFFLSRNGKKSKTLNGDGSSIYEIELLDASIASFNLRAAATGTQTKDNQCQSFTLDSKGQRTAAARQKEDATRCWR